MEYFTDDAIYHNMPIPPRTGKPAIREGIEVFISCGTSTKWIITTWPF